MTLGIAPHFCRVAAGPLRRLEWGQYLPHICACPRCALFLPPPELMALRTARVMRSFLLDTGGGRGGVGWGGDPQPGGWCRLVGAWSALSPLLASQASPSTPSPCHPGPQLFCQGRFSLVHSRHQASVSAFYPGSGRQTFITGEAWLIPRWKLLASLGLKGCLAV